MARAKSRSKRSSKLESNKEEREYQKILSQLEKLSVGLKKRELLNDQKYLDRLVSKAFSGKEAKIALRELQEEGKEIGISSSEISKRWNENINQLRIEAREGTLYDWSLSPRSLEVYNQSEANIGKIIPIRSNAGNLLIVSQLGETIVMQQSTGGFLDPDSVIGKTIKIVDIILEVLGALLLLFNITLPKINWRKMREAFQRGAISKSKLSKLMRLIAILGELIAAGADSKQIIDAAVKILKLTWTMGWFKIIRKGLDVGFWEWLKILGKFILLSSLDTLTGGLAYAAKLTLVLAGIYEIVVKINDLKGS